MIRNNRITQSLLDAGYSLAGRFLGILGISVSREGYNQFIKHHLVGLFGIFLNYCIFMVLKWIGLETVLANTIDHVIVLVVIFGMQKYFTYRNPYNTALQFLLFLLNALGYYALDTSILYGLVDIIGMQYGVAKILSLGIITPASFLSQKFIVFKKREDSHE